MTDKSARDRASGREALEQFRQRHFDAVVTDMAMPDMDGIGVIRALLAYGPAHHRHQRRRGLG